MRIVSKFQDFYDCGQFYGVDKSLVYVRHTSKEPIDGGKWPDNCVIPNSGSFNGEFRNKKLTSVEYESKYVSFCGKIIPYVVLTFTKPMDIDEPFEVRTSEEYIYDMDDFKRVILKWVSENDYKTFLEAREKESHIYWNRSSYFHVKKFLNVVESIKILTARTADVHYKERCPTFLIDMGNTKEYNPAYKRILRHDSRIAITLNPELKKIGFYKVEDPYTAYREIEMFMGGVVSQKENEIVQISDGYMAQAKGFDCYSFKKAPSKKGRGKKACPCPK